MGQLIISAAINPTLRKYWQDRYATDNTFSTARGASTGTQSGAYVGCEKNGVPYYVFRNFTSYDTSSIPDHAIITSATLAFVNSGKDTSNDFNVCLTQSTAGDTSLADDDFNNITLNSPTELADRTAAVSTFDASATITFTLNASGLSHISKTGYTKFCFRSSKDVDNSTPTARSYCSMGTGTFTINYTDGGNPMFFSDGGVTLG